MRIKRHWIHSLYIQLQLCNMPLTQSLQKFLQDMTGYDGTTSWCKYSDAVEEWCDLTKVEARRRGPAIAARLSFRAELFKERLDRERRRDPETRVEHFLSTLRPFFVKDLQICVPLSIFPNIALQQRTNRSSMLDGEVRDCETKGSGHVA